MINFLDTPVPSLLYTNLSFGAETGNMLSVLHLRILVPEFSGVECGVHILWLHQHERQLP